MGESRYVLSPLVLRWSGLFCIFKVLVFCYIALSDLMARALGGAGLS